jgi:hypothetical protein
MDPGKVELQVSTGVDASHPATGGKAAPQVETGGSDAPHAPAEGGDTTTLLL